MMSLIRCSLDEFADKIQNRDLYCFGYGAASKLFLNILCEYNLEKRVTAFVDNNLSKVGNDEYYNGIAYRIISLKELTERIGNGCILITCSDVDGVVKQLESISEFSDVECFSMHMMLSEKYLKAKTVGVLRRDTIQRIPKKIHYCWFGGKEIPDSLKVYIETWKRYCPDYEIIRWDETNYNISQCQYAKEAYEKRKWGFVADYVRLDVIYRYGGIYFDTDVEVIKNLDDILYQEAFSIFDVQLHVNLGNGFGAVAGHPLIKEMRDYYDSIRFIDQYGNCDLTTCVMHQYNVLKKYGMKMDGSYQTVCGMTIYPADINGIDAYSHIEKVSENTIIMHHGLASWLPPTLSDAREKRIQLLKNIFQDD